MNINEINHKIFTISNDYVLYRGNEKEKNFFLFNISTGKIFKLNETSFIILESFSNNLPLSDILDRLTRKFLVDKNILTKDLSTLMEKWIEKNILISNE